ncbi:MAG: transporter substrate-binding domain-containing protein [Cyanobacteria bacterium P01_D01_bin.1]
MLPPFFRFAIAQLRQLRITLLFVLSVLILTFTAPQFIPTSGLTDSALAKTVIAEDTQASADSDWLLQIDDRNQKVVELQRDLKNFGYEAVGRTPGLFDSATERAVRRFQRSAGLTVDGIVGPITRARLAAMDGGRSVPNETLIDEGVRQSFPPDIQRIVDRGTLVVSLLDRDNPPFFMTSEDDQLKGSDVKMARAIAAALEVDLEFRRTATTFNEVVDDVYALNADIAISKISRTLQRAKRTRFSEPYLNLRQGLLVNRVALAEAAHGEDMAKMIRNLEGKIGVIKGSSYAGFAKQRFPRATVISYPNWKEVVEAVTKGDVLAAYRDELEVKKIVLSQPDAALKFQTIALTDTHDPLAVVLPWDSKHLLSFVNQYLESSELNYTTDTLLEEYADYFES